MDYGKFVKSQIADIKKTIGKEKAISALSGGVDSSVATLLAYKAIGSNLKVIFIDTGQMRQDEPQQVKKTFAKLGIKVQVIDARKQFFAALKGLTDPEEKRKAFRDTFYKTFSKAVKTSGSRFLVQGTIAPDIIETRKAVKTQHNVLGQIGIDSKRGYGFTAVEPLKTLFKPDVRQVGKILGLPAVMHQRMPFPGPGLSCRVVGEVTPDRVEIVRRACKIVEEETKQFKPFQAFGVLLADRATGLKRDGTRAFGNIVAIRCVDSKNAMTAKPTKVTWAAMVRMQERIVKEIPGVTKVLYDLTPKPPSTIEYI